MKKTKRRAAVILIASSLLIFLFIVSFNSLFPIVNARVAQYSRSYATEVINTAVKTVLERNGAAYSDMVKVVTDSEGNVISLSADTVAVNKLKSEISLQILEMLSDESRRMLRIPVGNLTGMYLLSGRGFKLSVRLIPTDSILTETVSSFSDAGINQSWHRISMSITVRLGVVVLGKHSSIDVKDIITVADTVIVGRVPDAYTDIEKVDSETAGDIVDFMAE